MRSLQKLGAAALLQLLAACATPPPPEPIAARVVTPDGSERVMVDQALIVADASGSMTSGPEFERAKALTRAFVAGMPEGSYRAGAIAFGGTERATLPVESFRRDALQRWAEGIPEFGETTPVTSVLRESGAALGAGSGRTALILFSDGLPMSNGSRSDATAALAAARRLSEERSGALCIHTVQVGDAPDGAAFLESLAAVSGCGLARAEADLTSPQDLLGFQRAIFLGAAAPALASPRDRDGDGVVDGDDRCPRTPRGAKVDSRGCWVLAGLNFDTDRAEIKSGFRPQLDEVMTVLRENPDVRIRVDGHTDDRGSSAYNQALSERRAAAVANYITARGIDPSRVESKGFGESAPAVPNDSPENRYRNRRTELSVID